MPGCRTPIQSGGKQKTGAVFCRKRSIEVKLAVKFWGDANDIWESTVDFDFNVLNLNFNRIQRWLRGATTWILPTLCPSPLVLSASCYARARGHRCPHLAAFVACCSVHCDPPPSSDVALVRRAHIPASPPTASHPLPLRLDPTFRLRVYTILDFVSACTRFFVPLLVPPANIYYILFSHFRTASCVKSCFIW